MARSGLFLSLLLGFSAFGQVMLGPGCAVVIDPAEPAALRRAAEDLAADLSRVLGRPSTVVAAAPPGPHIVVCLSRPCPAGVERPSGAETLRIQTAGGAVVLTGSDLRGAIYAAYEFAERFLGVEPLHYWLDQEPRRLSRITVPETPLTLGPPSFRYRGWFINDEDLLTGWCPARTPGAAISLECWDRIFEALLRLKGNMIVPGTFIFPDEPQVRAASERGLVITQHHLEVLGTNTYRWPEDQPYALATHPQLLLNAWRNSLRAYRPEQEVIWTVGFRGKHDVPFWRDDPSAGATDEERARTIRKAIDLQVELVRNERPGAYLLMNAWREAAPFIRRGLLSPPPGVTLVWPDNGHGILEDEGRIGPGQGVYYHTAMFNSAANQLTEMVPLERIERELGRAARARATEYLLVNTSDLRPVVLTTEAVMRLAWDSRPWTEPSGGQAARFLDEWCRRQYGAKAAPAAANYYRAYFAAPGRYGPAEEDTLADNAYHTFARSILLAMLTGRKQAPARHLEPGTSFDEFLALAAKAVSEARPRWEQARGLAVQAASLVDSSRRQFFCFHGMTQLEVHEHSNRMLGEVIEAWRASDGETRMRHLRGAEAAARSVLDALRGAEYGKWKGFFAYDLFVNVRHTLRLIQAELARSQGLPVPADTVLLPLPQDSYTLLKAYQGDRRVPVE